MNKSAPGAITPFFQTIALKQVRDKKTAKDSLGDLFACIEKLNEACEELSVYAASVTDSGYANQVGSHLKSLENIQVELLGIAQQKVLQHGAPDAAVEEVGNEAEEPETERVSTQKFVHKVRR